MSKAATYLHYSGQYEYEPNFNMHETLFPRDLIDEIKEFEMAAGDVVVATYPKAGTTWMQEILYQVQTGADTKSEASTKVPIFSRVPFMEANFIHNKANGLEMIRGMSFPHLMKSHLPARFFEKQLDTGKAKFIIVMRNVKDNLVSYYHFYPSVKELQYKGTWEQYFEAFKAKQLLHGDWLDFNLSWWERKANPNILIVKYEEMKKDLKAAILKVAEFTGEKLSEEQMNKIMEHTSFENMKARHDVWKGSQRKELAADMLSRDKISPFFRKGVVGDWEAKFTPEQDEFVEISYVQPCKEQGLEFEYK